MRHAPRTTKGEYRENPDPEWSGHDLIETLENYSVYPPAIFPRLIEHAWLSWRRGDLNAAELQEELDVLAEWLNEASKTKPKTEFWRGYF